jgi:hypothetical protein
MEATLLFVGVLVSLVVQAAKKYLGTTSLGTLVLVAVLSVAAAAVVVYAKYAGFYEGLLNILATAGAFYAFIIRTLENKDELASEGLSFVK